MAKYEPLGKWLSEQTANTCTLTFNQVEKIIGGALPESATTHRTWWANHRSHSQAQSWMSAGWKVENLRLIAKQVRFTRVDQTRSTKNIQTMPPPLSAETQSRRKLHAGNPPGALADKRANMTVVIQCAAGKVPAAGHDGHGHLANENGKPVIFVADRERAPTSKSIIYRRPEDIALQGLSWRDVLVRYNEVCKNNEDWNNKTRKLLPAYKLFKRDTYRKLVEKFGCKNVFILSAGWGLIAADFLTPVYDITLSNNRKVEDYKRRRRGDPYQDFSMLPKRVVEPIVFLGGKDYVPLFCSLTKDAGVERIVYFNSKEPPQAPHCECIRFKTTTRTNWHYECAAALIRGELNPRDRA